MWVMECKHVCTKHSLQKGCENKHGSTRHLQRWKSGLERFFLHSTRTYLKWHLLHCGVECSCVSLSNDVCGLEFKAWVFALVSGMSQELNRCSIKIKIEIDYVHSSRN